MKVDLPGTLPTFLRADGECGLRMTEAVVSPCPGSNNDFQVLASGFPAEWFPTSCREESAFFYSMILGPHSASHWVGARNISASQEHGAGGAGSTFIAVSTHCELDLHWHYYALDR